MDHLLDKIFFETNGNLKGLIFGFVHVSIMIVGYYTGISINRFLKLLSNGYIAGIFGASLSHIIADVVACYLDPHLRNMILGIVVGGIIPLSFIPFLEKCVSKKNNYINKQSHDDY